MKLHLSRFVWTLALMASPIYAADLNLSTNPTHETIGGKRYVIIKKGDSVTFSASPSKTLTSLSWSFENGSPATGTGNGPVVVAYSGTATIGKANAVKFTSSRTENSQNCTTSNKITCHVVVPKVEYKQTGGSGSLTGKIDYPLDLSYDAHIGIVNTNDVELNFTPTSLPASEIKWSGLTTGTGHTLTLSAPASGDEVLKVKNFTHTFKIQRATVTGLGKAAWASANIAKAGFIYSYSTEATNWAHAYPLGDTQVNENKTDAARHAYWNAIVAAEYTVAVAIEASTANEVDSLSNPGYARNSICMDMYNNAIGASIGGVAGVTTRSTLQTEVINSLTAGHLVTLRRPSNSGQNELLIPSNQPYAP